MENLIELGDVIVKQMYFPYHSMSIEMATDRLKKPAKTSKLNRCCFRKNTERFNCGN